MISLLKPYLKKYLFALIILVFLNLVNWLITLIAPYISGKYLDNLINIHNKDIVIKFTFYLILLKIISILVSYLFNINSVILQNNIMFDFNFDILNRVKKFPIFFFKNKDSTYLNQRINSDINTITTFILNNFISIFIKIGTLIFSFYFLFKINVKLSLLITPLTFFYFLIYLLLKKPLYSSGYSLKENQNKFFAKMNEQLYNIKIIKLNSWFEYLNTQLQDKYKILFSSIRKYMRISYIFDSASSIISNIANIIIFFFGGLEILNNSLSIGDFTIISSYFNLLLDCTSFFASLGKSYQDSLVSYSRIKSFLDINLESNGNIILDDIKEIEFKNVNFLYDNEKKILTNFNFKFNKNNIYCIIGNNGSGKTTLINLISGLFIDSYNGEINYNSIEIHNLNLYSLRKNLIGILEQEPLLFKDTIKNNLLYGNITCSNENLDLLIKKLNLNYLIDNLPNGLDTVINEKSNNISGGEKQKLSLLRVLIKNPDVIILDEPTSALDFKSMQKLQALLNELKHNKIIIIVTHDNNLIQLADQVLKLE